MLFSASTALALLLALSGTGTESRMVLPSWSPELRTSMHRTWEAREDSPELLQSRMAAYAREGRFPKSGRSLETKIREATKFMEQQLGDPSTSGIGVSAAIVYKDKVCVWKRRLWGGVVPDRLLRRWC